MVETTYNERGITAIKIEIVMNDFLPDKVKESSYKMCIVNEILSTFFTGYSKHSSSRSMSRLKWNYELDTAGSNVGASGNSETICTIGVNQTQPNHSHHRRRLTDGKFWCTYRRICLFYFFCIHISHINLGNWKLHAVETVTSRLGIYMLIILDLLFWNF